MESGVLRGVRVVCHLAAHVPADHADPDAAATCLKVNALATLQLLTAARDAGVDAFIYMSSGNIYAAGLRAAEEGDPVWPAGHATYYLGSKALGDLYVQHAGHHGWMRTVQLRPSAIYGSGMKGGVVLSFARRLLAGERVVVQDGGRHRVDLVHVDDVVDATVRAIDRDVAGPFNIGSGRATSILELSRVLARAAGVSEEHIEVEPPKQATGGGFAALDIARARQELAWEPRAPAVGLAELVRALAEAT